VCYKVVCDKVVCGRVVYERIVCERVELCVTELCVKELCVKELCEKVVRKEFCVRKLCATRRQGEKGEADGRAQQKNKNLTQRCGGSHHMFGALLEVALSKKCTPLRCEAHLEVKMLETPHVRVTFQREIER